MTMHRHESRLPRAAAAVVGVAAMAAGGAATFVSSNGAGAAGLVASGAVLVLFVVFGEKIEWLRVGSIELHLREAADGLARQADLLEARGDAAAAEQLREEARLLLLRASPAARSYEIVRRTRPPGAERVIELSSIVSDARAYARSGHPSPDSVRAIFASGGEGERVYALALMQEAPHAENLDSILDAICHSRSAFEQGQALAAGIRIVPLLSPADKARLRDAVHSQLAVGGHIARSTDRRHLAEQLVGLIDD
jgi:hypothetical protein